MADSSINTGAKITVAARALNMSEIEVAGMVESLQRQARLKKGVTLTPEQAADAVLARLRKVYAINQEMPGDIDSLLTIPNRDVQFGEQGNQDELQNFGGLDKDGRVKDQVLALDEREKVKQSRDPNVFLRKKIVGKDDEGRKQYGMEEVFIPEGRPLPDEFKDQAILRDFGLRIAGRDKNGDDIVVPFREEVAPAQNILKQELSRLNEGINLFGAEAFGNTINSARGVGPDITGGPVRPGFRDPNIVIEQGKRYTPDPLNIANVAGRIEDDLRPGKQAEAALVREMVIRDNARFSPEYVEANDWKRNAEAQDIARRRFGINGGGAQADDALARIGVIGKIGHAKNAADFNVGVNSIYDGRGFNYDALPIDLAERYERQAEIVNAPIQGELSSRMQWLANNVPDNRDNGVFGDFPQVAINEQLNAVNDGLRRVNFGGQGIDPSLANVRGINGLQRAVDAVLALGAEKGEGFFKLEDGKNIAVANPGINEVLQKIGFNDNRKQNLAGALFALEMAQDKRKGDIQNDRRIFGGMDLNNGMPVARVGRAKIEGKEVAAQLQALDGRRANPPLNAQELGQARMPFIGGVQGESISRAQFLRGKGVGMTPDQRVAAFGPKNAAIANRLERERDILFGMPKGPVDPANPPSGAVDSFAEQLRGKDAEIAQLAQLRNEEANIREINEAFERMGMPLEGKGQMLLGGQIVRDSIDRPERNSIPSAVANNPALNAKRGAVRDIIGQPVPERFAGKINSARVAYAPPAQVSSQQATSSVVNPVSQVSPEMGNGGIPPQPPVTAVASPAPEPEKYQRMGYKFRPDGASRGNRNRREVIKRLERGRVQRRTGAAVGGAVAGLVGLDALIGGERDKRDQEVYQ